MPAAAACRPTAAAAAGPGPGEFLTFRLGAEEYAIDILRVQEIRGHEPPTRIAGAPAAVCGVLNLRGVIVPIIDLRVRLGVPAQFGPTTVTIVLRIGGRTVGAVVDTVCDVVELNAGQIRPAPALGAAVDAGILTGLASLRQGGRDRMLVLMDIQRLLANAGLGMAEAEAA